MIAKSQVAKSNARRTVVAKFATTRRRIASTTTAKSARAKSPKASSPLAPRMLQDLQLAGHGERTQEAYLRAVRQLAAHTHLPPDQISEDQLRAYFLYLKNHKAFAPGSLKIAYNGIRFFYSHTVVRDWETLRNLRVPKQRTLPAVLSTAEEFLRRFLQHVLPSGFQKVRHYGFAAAANQTDFESIRWLVTLAQGLLYPLIARADVTEKVQTAVRCAECGGLMCIIAVFSPPDYHDTS